jgi:alkylation response protein AidB-like acyl-CoA dehydrogenase
VSTAVVASIEEQAEFRNNLRRFFAQRSTSAHARSLGDTSRGYDNRVWEQVAVELGLIGIAVPERFHGSGFTAIEQAIVLEEMGRVLFCGPYVSSAVLAVQLLLACEEEGIKEDVLPGVLGGQVIATAAVLDSTQLITAAPLGDSWALDGAASHVLDGHVADVILIPASTPDGSCLFLVESDAEGLTRAALPTLDRTRKQARLTLTTTPARRLADAEVSARAISVARRHVEIALAAEALGGAQAALDMTVEYAKARFQFGRSIGSFQAVKHKCADMLVAVELGKAILRAASVAAAENAPELALLAIPAYVACSDAYLLTANETIQIHGGIGFTWEHDAHLHLRRAASSRLLLGHPSGHYEQIANNLGI